MSVDMAGGIVIPLPQAQVLSAAEAASYAEWFVCLAEPVRVRLLHAVTTSPRGITIGSLTEILGVSQSTCSHHVRKLADVGLLGLAAAIFLVRRSSDRRDTQPATVQSPISEH
jgi:DNA-binding transcriptional ArsR family regulator